MTDPRVECACGNRIYGYQRECDECTATRAADVRAQKVAIVAEQMAHYAQHLKSMRTSNPEQIRDALDLARDIHEGSRPPHHIAARLIQSAERHRNGSTYIKTCMTMLAETLTTKH